MQYRALATDYDGTLAQDGHVSPETLDALRRLRASGRKVILVTGRELPELQSVFPDLAVCDAVVAENGGLLYWPAEQREEVLVGLSTGKVTFDDGLPARTFWTTLYQTVMEGMFSDPIYGGNRNKAGWRLIGFPGVIAVHRENIVRYRDKKFPADPVSIADMS